MSETIPPLTQADVDQFLTNPSFSVYLYLGNEGDVGWENAQLAYGLLPRIRIYRVSEEAHSDVRTWLSLTETDRGVVFGYQQEVVARLNQSEADDFRRVIDEILRARGGTP